MKQIIAECRPLHLQNFAGTFGAAQTGPRVEQFELNDWLEPGFGLLDLVPRFLHSWTWWIETSQFFPFHFPNDFCSSSLASVRILSIMMNATTVDHLLNGPAMAPPPGVIPNFVDPPSLQKLAILSLVLHYLFSTLVVLMRLYTKIFILRQMASEDCMSWNLAYSSDKTLMLDRRHHFRMGENLWTNL